MATLLMCSLFMLSGTSLSSAHILSSGVNPGCEEQLGAELCRQPYLFYVLASKGPSFVHVFLQLWQEPGVLLLAAESTERPALNWTRFLAPDLDAVGGCLQADATAAYSASFSELVEFDDSSDSGDLYSGGEKGASRSVQFGRLLVANSPVTVTGSRVTVETLPLAQVMPGWSGKVSVTFDLSVMPGHSSSPPHLRLSESSALLHIAISQLRTDSGFKHSRFGVRLLSTSTGHQYLDQYSSIDDHYTPGVFRMYNVHIVGNESGAEGPANETAYVQWKPVCYTEREGAAAPLPWTAVRVYNLTGNSTARGSRLTRAYFCCAGGAPYTVTVSFGATGDGWYRRTNFTAWSFVVSLGRASADSVSLLLQLLLLAAAAVPAALLLGGSCWLWRRQQAARALSDSQAEEPLISEQ